MLSGEEGSRLAGRIVTVIPVQQTALKPDESVSVPLLIEGVDREPEGVGVSAEVTGVWFECERGERDG